jgi:hypothetical protein
VQAATHFRDRVKLNVTVKFTQTEHEDLTMVAVMADLKAGQKIWAPNPNGEGEVRAVFHAVVIDDPAPGPGGVARDRAWVHGMRAIMGARPFKAFRYKLRPRGR